MTVLRFMGCHFPLSSVGRFIYFFRTQIFNFIHHGCIFECHCNDFTLSTCSLSFSTYSTSNRSFVIMTNLIRTRTYLHVINSNYIRILRESSVHNLFWFSAHHVIYDNILTQKCQTASYELGMENQRAIYDDHRFLASKNPNQQIVG